MKIKNRLSLYFTIISAVTLLFSFTAIYIASSTYEKADFYSRLLDRAKVAAQLYLEADEISRDSLSRVKERYLKPLQGEVVRFYNEKNTASFIKDQQQYWGSNIINLVRHQKQVEFNEGQSRTVGVYYNDNQGDFVILVSAVDIQGRHRLESLIQIMAIMFFCAITGLFFGGRWFAKKALEPINDVVKQMQLVRANNLSFRVGEGNGKDEISELAQNFNRLLSHLQNAFELQQTFVTNASHELRTPVTSIIGEIEVALNKLRTAGEYESLLQSVLVDAERLNETITGLLELAQVDMNYTQAALTDVAIDELIWELNDYWIKRGGKGSFNVKIIKLPEDPEKLIIAANKLLLFIALSNIIGNAFKFSDNKQVQCALYADDRSIRITITDLGIGIPIEEKEKVFQSFYRGTNVNNYRGSGIGLYVTGKIINLFNGAISIDAEYTAGTSIIVEFYRGKF